MKHRFWCALFLLALIVLALGIVTPVHVTAAQQNNDKACPYANLPSVNCAQGYHGVWECICDGPMGPCHWVSRCIKN